MILAKPGTTVGNLAATGSTGNNTHTGVRVRDDGRVSAIQFVVEAAGATPTVTWQAQGSLDGVNWFNLAYVTDASSTLATAALTATGVGAQVIFLENATVRNYNFFRLVTSANTNITYRGELYTEVSL